MTGILVNGGSTIDGAIAAGGTILATNHAIAIDATSMIDAAGTGIVANGATLTGGISNPGTIAAAGGRGVFIGGAFNVSGSTFLPRGDDPDLHGRHQQYRRNHGAAGRYPDRRQCHRLRYVKPRHDNDIDLRGGIAIRVPSPRPAMASGPAAMSRSPATSTSHP